MDCGVSDDGVKVLEGCVAGGSNEEWNAVVMQYGEWQR